MPGEAMPTDSISEGSMPAFSQTVWQMAAMSAVISAAERSAPVGMLALQTISNFSLTIPAAMLVPPRSIPMRYIV